MARQVDNKYTFLHQSTLPVASIEETVKRHYTKIALATDLDGCCAPSSGSPQLLKRIKKTISRDYSDEELTSVPFGAYLGEGSGNPVRHADLKLGEQVVDLGSGAGIDVFLAANKVGSNGHVIGIDMTTEMLRRAEENARRGGYKNVEFKHSRIEELPLESNTEDVVISNCVINLSQDKEAVFREAYRVLRHGGRLAISDIITEGRIPDVLRKNLGLYCNCVSGAMERSEYIKAIENSGFSNPRIVASRPSSITMPPGVVAIPIAVTLLATKE